MIGVVVVGHGKIASAMVDETKNIIPDMRAMLAVDIQSNLPAEHNRRLIATAIKEVNSGSGVLLLTDMFGGTPSNLCLSFLNDAQVEVSSGFNLPMLIKLAGSSRTETLQELICFIQNYGQRNIVIASKVLSGEVQPC